jgi:hypothetical protein
VTPTCPRRPTLPALLLLLPLLFGGCEGLLPERDPAPSSERRAGIPAQTPLAEAGFDSLTSHEALLAFLDRLDRSSPRVTLRELGTSPGERTIPYLEVSLGTFGADRERRTLVLVYAQQHGNEPSGKEGVLELALELARGDHDDLLEGVDLLLVPQVNPDGAEAHRRANDLGTDLNRSHLVLEGPEVEALRALFHRWEPEVAVDAHEYYPWSDPWLERGWLRLWDLQVGLPTNLNTDPGILRLAEGAALPRILETLRDQGFTAHNYVVGTPERLRWSTTNPNDGRQGFALLHTLSLIYEGKRSEPLATGMERRAGAQRLGLEALLRFAAEEGPEIRRVVRGARERAISGEIGRVVLAMDRTRASAPLRIPVEAVTGGADGEWLVGDTVEAVIEGWYPGVREVSATSLPWGYLVPASEEGLIDLLRRHGVAVGTLELDEEFSVERLRIDGFRTVLLDSEQDLPVVSSTRGRHAARRGDALVLTAQLRGLLAAVLLEPGSMHGAHTYEAFRHLAREGAYPVLRVERP